MEGQSLEHVKNMASFVKHTKDFFSSLSLNKSLKTGKLVIKLVFKPKKVKDDVTRLS